MRRVAGFAAGRRSKWVVIGAWVIVAGALFQFQPKLDDATTNENEAFLPESAESTATARVLDERFAAGREVDALVVYRRPGGLREADRRTISRDALEIAGIDRPDPAARCENQFLPGAIAVVDPFRGPVCGAAGLGGEAGSGPQVVSGDGSTALLLVRTDSEDSDQIQDEVAYLREVVPDPGRDRELGAHVTGLAGIVSDSTEIFQSIDVTLLAVTVTLVLLLLLAIYRSPTIALVPLFTVALAYGIAAAATLGMVEAGLFEVNTQTTSILIVLMFGAGTDYCLLIVSRYREELRRSENKHEAMVHAAERTGPPILSAGGTVVAAMLVLPLADLKATQTMGPVLALGIAIMLLAGLTLLPALLAALGRNAFWPSIPRHRAPERRRLGTWRRIGHFVHENPALALVATVALLAAGGFGNLKERGVTDFGEGFRDNPESVEGQRLIEDELAPGLTAPTHVVVDADAVDRVAAALSAVSGVAEAAPAGVSDDGALARIDVTLAFDPFSDEASDTVPELRAAASSAAGGTALVGGTTAENFDTSETLRSDARLLVPLVLLLILLILSALLRAVVAPLYLVATVVLSYAFALGATTLIFTEILNQPDSDPALPTLAFIFLVALGVDYNIFLVSRIREEAGHQETKEAVITGLERTGGVITSAGLILAGTFSALMSVPLEALFQIGFTIAFGLLVDTFLVRTLLVPAIAFKLGERNWWPSRVSPAVRQI